MPTVKMTNRMANVLRVMYNEQNPHCSPEDAATRLLALPEYRDSLHVRYVMTADKIKVFFGSLKKKKKDGQVPELHRTATADGYKTFNTVPQMRAEYDRRVLAGVMAKPMRMPTKKVGWAALLELNDMQQENLITHSGEEDSHSEEAAEKDDESLEEDSYEPEDMSLEECLLAHDALGDDSME